jgi:hypothetical protein
MELLQMKKIFSALFTSLCALYAPHAGAFELGLPIKCSYGKDCYIQNYYDEDASADYKDYSCGKLSYNGHDGTDFRVTDYAAMEKGVDVIASAAGTVFATRDSMEDINVKLIDRDAINKQGCGNAVVLLHPGGYKTMYCHMKKGSIVVKKGDSVAKGQKLGQVGLSGLTEFPHVHLGVLKDGKKIDPFTGGQSQTACGAQQALWDKEAKVTLSYISTGLLASSFSGDVPEAEAARAGKYTAEKIAQDAKALILWADIFGLQPQDRLTLTMMAPDKKILASKSFDFTKSKAVFFQYIGIKNKDMFEKGHYTGTIQLKRGDKLVVDESRTMTVY